MWLKVLKNINIIVVVVIMSCCPQLYGLHEKNLTNRKQKVGIQIEDFLAFMSWDDLAISLKI